VLVASWINETQAKRAAAAVSLKRPARRRRMTEEEIMSLVPGNRIYDCQPVGLTGSL
jgi:hypothetical protein